MQQARDAALHRARSHRIPASAHAGEQPFRDPFEMGVAWRVSVGDVGLNPNQMQPSKAPSPTVVRAVGRSSWLSQREVHPRKASTPIVARPAGRLSWLREEQSSKE